MAFDAGKLIDTIETAMRIAHTVVTLAEDTVEALSPADQSEFRRRLIELRAENEAGFDRLQAKLAKLIFAETPND